MLIPESQLVTWSNQGPIQSSANTYNSIKNCINSAIWNSDEIFKIYLQGSYKNSTNIYGNSDVDIVVEFESVFHSDTTRLDNIGMEVFNSFGPAKYTLQGFKEKVIQRLKDYYGSNSVDVGNKAIKIKGNGSRLDADVVVCNSYKKYIKNNGSRSLDAVKGIRFMEEHSYKTIINYPGPHYDNGVNKNTYSETWGNFKQVIRIFKNMKAKLVDKGMLNSSLAPSYFVECLIYNANNSNFKNSDFRTIITMILKQFETDELFNKYNKYVCQNYQRYLFGSGDQQWNENDAKEFVRKINYLWSNYPL